MLLDFDWVAKMDVSYPTWNLNDELLEGRASQHQIMISEC